MADYGELMALSATAVADLRNQQYHAVRLTGAYTTNMASHAAGAAATLFGILQNKPNSGQSATIAYFGESKVIAGGSINANVWLTTNGSGRATTAASGDLIFGMSMQAAVNDGDAINALIFPVRRLSGAV